MNLLQKTVFPARLAVCLLTAAAAPSQQPAANPTLNAAPRFPFAERLSYKVTWRMVTAGQADLKLTEQRDGGWQLDLKINSLGLVNQLYRVADSYQLATNAKFCGTSLSFDSQEGKHHNATTITFDNQNHKASATIKDLVANQTQKNEIDIPGCAYEIAGALMTLRASQLDPGMKFNLPVTNGKRLAQVRVEGLGKEKLTLGAKSYNTVRYETFLFDNVLYHRKGRLLIWVSDDAERIPVQMRFVFGFPLGDVTLELQKEERL